MAVSSSPFRGSLPEQPHGGPVPEGVQIRHGADVKHFAANNQEYRRMSISAVVDERALREIYLAAFEMVVKEAKPWTLMCSYNRINGVYSSENEWLLNRVLRKDGASRAL